MNLLRIIIICTHLKHHKELKTCFCEICGKEFAFQGQLNSHLKTHCGEKKYQCEECGKVLKSSEVLKIHLHLQRHKGIKPYICGEKLGTFAGI